MDEDNSYVESQEMEEVRRWTDENGIKIERTIRFYRRAITDVVGGP